MNLTQKRGALGFTLVEVILAVVIMMAILTVVLYFYHQAAEVRSKAIEETEYITTARRFIDQVSAELQTAQSVPQQFIGLEGSSNWISFVTTSIPATTRWIVRTNESVATFPLTDLKRIEYNLPVTTNRLELLSLIRMEKLLGAAATIETNIVVGTNSLSEPGMVVTSETNSAAEDLPHFTPGLPLTDRLQYLRFRYFDGREWVDSWTALDLPRGVEISVGPAPMPLDETGAYPFELFQRKVFLPLSEHPGNQLTNAMPEEVLF